MLWLLVCPYQHGEGYTLQGKNHTKPGVMWGSGDYPRVSAIGWSMAASKPRVWGVRSG
jgi:hypothetical protein